MEEAELLHIRLITGEDIITQVVDSTRNGMTIEFPMKVILLPTDSGAFRISLMEWVFFRVSPDQLFDIKERDILTTSVPSDLIADYYWNALDVLEEKREKADAQRLDEETKEIEDMMDEMEDQVDESNNDFLKTLLNSLKSNGSGTLH